MAGRCSAPRASVVIFDAGTAGARIADQFRVVMPLGTMIIVGAGA